MPSARHCLFAHDLLHSPCPSPSPFPFTNAPSTGHLWRTGYTAGDLTTPLFPDVLPTLEKWKNTGKTLAVFSSGSVQAQLQFFSHVKVGDGDAATTTRDVRPLFAAHFDTVTAGPKFESASYRRVCTELGAEGGAGVAFLTDNVLGELMSLI